MVNDIIPYLHAVMYLYYWQLEIELKICLGLRSLLRTEDPAADVLIARTELRQLVERCEDVRQKLHSSNTVKYVRNQTRSDMRIGKRIRAGRCDVARQDALFLISLRYYYYTFFL